jgi:hypothetical protein
MTTAQNVLALPDGNEDANDPESNDDERLQSHSSTSSIEENNCQGPRIPGNKPFSFSLSGLDKKIGESAKFAFRVSLALTISSLFSLCFGVESEQVFPDAIWIYISACVVSWQATPDTGSVLQKLWQRAVGTTIGGLLGLGLGAISLTIPEQGSPWQAAYIGVCNSIVSFAIVYCVCEHGLRAHYASILGTLTFGMALLPFYQEEPLNAWNVAVFRIIDIVIGGLIGSIASLMVFPVSTRTLIDAKISNSTKQAGYTALEVLSAIGTMGRLPTIVRDKATEDPGHAAYRKGMEDIHSIKALFPLLNYDPIFACINKQEKEEVIGNWMENLERIMRVQMNIICLDNLVRNGFVDDEISRKDFLRQVGKHVAVLLDGSETRENHSKTILAMLDSDLQEIRIELSKRRKELFSLAEEPSLTVEEMIQKLSQFDDDLPSPVADMFFMKQTVLFYQMVEMLILRSIRLYNYRCRIST